ncbi:hypothetical protein, partial [uncultured Jannaschia sp.]|uniref:hypothetical protein n=1 Tax=uncultured Jannaschia sp. TaxID=293347 RepID=UPI0026301DA0
TSPAARCAEPKAPRAASYTTGWDTIQGALPFKRSVQQSHPQARSSVDTRFRVGLVQLKKDGENVDAQGSL